MHILVFILVLNFTIVMMYQIPSKYICDDKFQSLSSDFDKFNLVYS